MLKNACSTRSPILAIAMFVIGCSGPPKPEPKREPAPEPKSETRPAAVTTRRDDPERVRRILEEEARQQEGKLKAASEAREWEAKHEQLVREWTDAKVACLVGEERRASERDSVRTRLADMEAAGLGEKDEAKLLRATLDRLTAEVDALEQRRKDADAVLDALNNALGDEDLDDLVARTVAERRAK